MGATFISHLGGNLTSTETVDIYGKSNDWCLVPMTTSSDDSIYIGYTGYNSWGNLVASCSDGDFERDCGDGDVVWTLNTGAGNDYVKIREDQNAYTVTKLGIGDDTYELGCTLDSNLCEAQTNGDARAYVFTESGDDTVKIGSIDGGRVFTGAGSDTITINGEVDDGGVIDLGSGNTEYANSHAEAESADTASDVNNLHIKGSLGECANYDYGMILGGKGQDNVTIDWNIKGVSTIDLGDNKDTVSVREMQHSSKIITGNHDDTVSVKGSLLDNSVIDTTGITADAIPDSIKIVYLPGSDFPVYVTIPGQAAVTDNDVVNVGYSTYGHSKIMVGDGENVINIGDDVDSHSSITAGKDKDILNVGDDTEDCSSINLGDGENEINIASTIEDYSSITTGKDADSLTVGCSITNHSEVNLGAGDNVVNVCHDIRGYAKLLTGDGNDTLNIGDDAQWAAQINLGDGNNTINIADNIADWASVQTGSGNDTLVVDGGAYNSAKVDLGAGDDVASFGNGLNYCSVIDGGEGFDTLNIGGGDAWCISASTKNFNGFEQVNLQDNASLKVNLHDLVADQASGTELFVNGGAQSCVNLDCFTNSNSSSTFTNTSGTTYDVYTKTVDSVDYSVYVQQGVHIIM